MSPNGTDRMANSVDPDQSDLGLPCLPRPVCPKTYENYSTFPRTVLRGQPNNMALLQDGLHDVSMFCRGFVKPGRLGRETDSAVC